MVVWVFTVVLLCFVLSAARSTAQPVASAPRPSGRDMTLALPHAVRPGESVWLVVEVGAIGHEQIEVTTPAGRPLGTISPYGIRSDAAAGTYTIPIPADALKNGRLTLRLSLMQGVGALRAPTIEEVKSVHLVVANR